MSGHGSGPCADRTERIAPRAGTEPAAVVEPLHVGIVAPPWLPVPPTGYGGTEAVLDRLAVGLQRAGHRVTLVAHPESTCPVHLAATGTFPGELGDPTAEAAHALAGQAILEELGVDVVHDHTAAGPSVATVTGLARRVPYVVTNHGPFDDDADRRCAALPTGTAVVAISEHHRATARRCRPAAAIHHGVDVDAFPAGDGRGGYAACLTRMDPAKGVDLAVGVARRAGLPLRIAAKMRSAAERRYFEAVIRPLLGPDVVLLGEVGGTDKLALLADAVALVNPVRWAEPFGMVMIESLACGTPVVAMPNGSVPEIVEDSRTGVVRPSLDALADGLSRVGELDRSACRARVTERFSTERMVAEHVRLYRRVLGRPRAQVTVSCVTMPSRRCDSIVPSGSSSTMLHTSR
jgi:glycosyltransferase involved in cell wall biosynthesis